MMESIVGLYFISFFLLFFSIVLKRSGIKKFFGRQVEKYIKFTKEEEEKPLTVKDTLLAVADFIAPLFAGKSLTDKLQLLIDKAGVPLRATEFMFFHGLGIAAAAIVGYVLMGPAGLVLFLATAVAGPIFGLKYMRKKRENKFHDQLPDTLSLVAGALKAGYSFLQAVDMTVKETTPPMSVEFKKVLMEARLGLPFEQALENMAARMDSESFDWTVMAIKIQREVGGNLAEILEILAETVRERDRVHRQIKALTAEGRMSALILVLLPFVIGMILWVVNPGYMLLLFTKPLGLAMLAGSLAMLGVGGVWLKKVVGIEV